MQKRILGKRLLSLLLTLAMMSGLVMVSATDGGGGQPESGTYVLDADALTPFAAGAKTDGQTEKAGTDDFFTVIWSAKSKVENKGKEFPDQFKNANRINFGGGVNTAKNAVCFTTDGAATVKIWWGAGDAGRQMGIIDGDKKEIVRTDVESVKDALYISELTLDEGGTYYLGGAGNNNYIHKIEVTAGIVEKPPRADWSTVAAPVITSAAVDGQDAHQILVNVSANVGYDGADKVIVTMTDKSGAAMTLSSAKQADTHTLTFTPDASGDYTFSAAVVRDGETDRAAEATAAVSFTLPLEQPYIKVCANAGGGSALLEWNPIAEAERYEIAVTGIDDPVTVTDCTATVPGLTVGGRYTFSVTALRSEDRSEAGTAQLTVTEDAELVWSFSAFGTGVTLKNNGYSGSYRDGAVQVYSTGGKGKLVPGSTDGLAFYYTKIDPNTQNFKLTATAKVDSWTLSNGQEGFGLMAADAVGANGDSDTFWNNSYMASVTKVEYSVGEDKYSMKLGVGSQEKIGVEPRNINADKKLNDMSVYSSKMTPLETSCADANLPAGTYNLVGKSSAAVPGTVEQPQDAFVLSIEKNNTGYFVSYTDAAGVTHTNKYYDTEALSHLEENAVYVGFFASRNATVTFTDIAFVTSDPDTDPPAEERPVTYVEPNYQVISAAVANNASYSLTYYGNADGTLKLTDESGHTLYNRSVRAKVKQNITVRLVPGENRFTLTMTPKADYRPSEYERLSSYESVTFTHSVSYAVNTQDVVYVAPDGSADAAGTKDDPQTIEAAVAKAIPGQTILMAEGVYSLSDSLIIERGMDGTRSKNIRLEADPDAAGRPVLDFGQNSAGIVLAGNYWHLTGFDVTNTKNSEKGIQVSGSYNTLERMETYRNGNTGIQIARFMSTDKREDWPHDNLILNCTSYLNADAGYEDADGFAAKLTIGEGNVFDGCISCYNVDDGWDLYAKTETGAIGMVTIKNSVAYKNGYILDNDGKEINAGNGNGFKMGGESIPGHHTLINSVAFANKSKGIDSNSCPDIQAYQSTSFDNESNNVAFYTNTASNTDFAAQGILSYKKSNSVAENIKPVGTQNLSKIMGATNYYYEGGKFVNTEGVAVEDDWFVSLDTAAVLAGGVRKDGTAPVDLGGVTRNEDGTISLGDYLKLTGKAPADTGARLDNVRQDKPIEETTTGHSSRPSSSGSASGSTAQTPAGNTPVNVTVPADSNGAVPVEAGVNTPISVSAPAGKTARIAVPVSGNQPGLVAMLLSPDGSMTVIRDSVYENGSLVFPVTGSATVKLVDNGKTFTDLGDSAELADAAAYLSARDIFRGMEENRFSPAQQLTRAMAVTLLYRLANESENAGHSAFADVPAGIWYENAVVWAENAGITMGDGIGFNPDGALTQEQLATLMYRYAQLIGLDVSARSGSVTTAQDWAQDALSWSSAAGLADQLSPAAPVTRADCAVFLVRFCKLK